MTKSQFKKIEGQKLLGEEEKICSELELINDNLNALNPN